MNGLDLFSGIGGISYALKEYVRTVAYCEIEQYCQAVLFENMANGNINHAPIWDDIKTLKGKYLPKIDIICGGFPCQDISVAGKGKGLAGERSALFWEVHRLVKETRPAFVFLENVPAIRTRGLREVIRAFADLRYDCRWSCISASSVGAPHRRKRWFLLAHANGEPIRSQQNKFTGGESASKSEHDGQHGHVADADGAGLEGHSKFKNEGKGQNQAINDCLFKKQNWLSEPDVGRVVNGLPFRVDRIKCLGNAVVPMQAKIAFEKLLGI